MLRQLKYLVQDPPPLLVFEINEQVVSAVRRNPKTFAVEATVQRELASGVLEPSAAHPNFPQPELFEETVRAMLEELGPCRRPDVAVILPDASSRLTVLDFDRLPGDTPERLRLIRFRLKKTVPFDVDQARIASKTWTVSSKVVALVAVIPPDIIRQYEAPFERAGLWPGFVSFSTISALNLLPDGEMTLLAKRVGRSLTMAAVERGVVKMIRRVDLAAADKSHDWANIAADLYPTIVFVNDNLGAAVSKVVLCGFGESLGSAWREIPRNLDCEVDLLRSGEQVVNRAEAGIWGYLSLN
jgi:type IV pilus assembly protein PilM